jgi:hypothetical protein
MLILSGGQPDLHSEVVRHKEKGHPPVG